MRHIYSLCTLLTIATWSILTFGGVNANDANNVKHVQYEAQDLLYDGPDTRRNNAVKRDSIPIFQRGDAYKSQLTELRSKISSDPNVPDNIRDAHVGRLESQLFEFTTFEELVTGMIFVYERAIDLNGLNSIKNGNIRGSDFDFKAESTKLITDFQLKIKHTIDHPEGHSPAGAGSPYGANQSPQEYSFQHHTHHHVDGDHNVADIVDDILSDVRHDADDLEKGMHHLMFEQEAKGAGAHLEMAVVKNGGDRGGGPKGLMTVIDQENNIYVLMRGNDTTAVYEDVQFLHDIILIIVCSFVLGWVFSLLGLPSFFGYILSGILLGPSGYDIIQELIQTETLSQFGVVFIIFVVGLEFSLDKIKAIWRLALGGALAILFVTVFVFAIGGFILGSPMNEVIFIAATVSLSSTAVVVKCVRVEDLEPVYGLLVMQDVLLGLMLAVMPALTKSGVEIFFAVSRVLVSLTLFCAIAYGIARVPAGFLLKRLQNTGSNELFLLGSLSVCLIMLLLSETFGLGMEIGCFFAGVVIRSRRQLFESSLALVEPVRDIFACLFFASIGLHIYPSFMLNELFLLLTLTAAVVGFKYITTSVTLVGFGFSVAQSSTMAIGLAQISEFGFVLGSRGKQLGIITREAYYILLAVTSLTLVLSPILWYLLIGKPGSPNSPSPYAHQKNGHVPVLSLPPVNGRMGHYRRGSDSYHMVAIPNGLEHVD